MKTNKRKKLEKNGWKVGSVAELLGLSPEEARRLAKHNRPREEAVIVFVSGEGEPEIQRVTNDRTYT